jgi:hypothetical protein
MDVDPVVVWTLVILAVVLIAAVLIAIALKFRESGKRPVDPEASLKLLLGPRGMVLGERNQAEAGNKSDAQRRKYFKGRKMSQIGILFDIDELGGGFYGHASYKVLFGALDTSQLLGCTLRDGDTNATLQGLARQCCISIEVPNASTMDAVRSALSKSTAKGLLPPSSRFIEDALVRQEPLVLAGRITSTGELTDCETIWVKMAWEEARRS